MGCGKLYQMAVINDESSIANLDTDPSYPTALEFSLSA